MTELRNGLSPTVVSGRIEMRTPDEVSAMLALKACGWESKRIAAKLGCSRNTVKRWLAEGSWCVAKAQRRPRALDGHEAWLGERFRRHAGNADVVRQELAAELGIAVSLRAVERAVAHLRQELRAEARATVRFETRPGQQLQIDFGERRVAIGDQMEKVFFFVATLGYSRRLHARAYRGERQEHWFDGMESCFRAFGGVPGEVLLDNARALIQHHDPVSREVVVNPKLHAFARHWGFKVKACAPYRARTKGKDERGVGYVKKNAIARSCASNTTSSVFLSCLPNPSRAVRVISTRPSCRVRPSSQIITSPKVRWISMPITRRMHASLASDKKAGTAGDTTTTDSRSRRNRASRRGGQLLTLALSSSNTNGLPAHLCSWCLCPGCSQHTP